MVELDVFKRLRAGSTPGAVAAFRVRARSLTMVPSRRGMKRARRASLSDVSPPVRVHTMAGGLASIGEPTVPAGGDRPVYSLC